MKRRRRSSVGLHEPLLVIAIRGATNRVKRATGSVTGSVATETVAIGTVATGKVIAEKANANAATEKKSGSGGAMMIAKKERMPVPTMGMRKKVRMPVPTMRTRKKVKIVPETMRRKARRTIPSSP